jgi:heat shock protein HspQ
MMLSDEWYETVARSRPPKDQPWYRVLVHNSANETYVAERNLELDASEEPVRHPMQFLQRRSLCICRAS